jgi:hypothetical protein
MLLRVSAADDGIEGASAASAAYADVCSCVQAADDGIEGASAASAARGAGVAGGRHGRRCAYADVC